MRSLCIAVLIVLLSSFSAHADVVRLVDISKVDCRAPCSRVAVVFVHGILGSQETWKNVSVSWPELLATDPEIGEKVDVYRVDFDSYLFSEGPSVSTVLLELQEQLDTLFATKNYSKVFLVGHSLGGIIARAYLLHVKAKFGHRVLSRFPVTYTLGTPTLGASLAKLASLASSNQQLRILLPEKVNDFQQLLNLTLVDVMNKHHVVYCPPLAMLSAFETLPMGLFGVIVSKESATRYSNFSRGFERDHSTLVKPTNRIDPVYRWVTDSMKTCIAGEEYCAAPILPECGRLQDGWPDSKWEVVPRLSNSEAVN